MTDVTSNKWRQWKRIALQLGHSCSVTKATGKQLVVVFGAKDTPNGKILSAKGKAK